MLRDLTILQALTHRPVGMGLPNAEGQRRVPLSKIDSAPDDAGKVLS